MKDLRDQTGLIELVMDESAVLFSEPEEGRLQFDGTENILTQPEFQEPDDVRRLIQIIEDEDRVVQVLENLFESDPDAVGTATVRIGGETAEEEMESYSIVTSPYRLGDTVGTLGVIGPTRMDYARAVALVENAANVINRPSDDEAPSPSDSTTDS
jgi:heat-inducible transcriptional repressor